MHREMVLQMDFQDSTWGQWRVRYQRLNNSSDQKVMRTRRLWMKKVHGTRVKGLKLWRSRKLKWKPFSIMFMLSRKIAKIYAGFVKRMKMDEACPAIIFSCQWGLPVLSHSSLNSRKNSISCYRSLSWF